MTKTEHMAVGAGAYRTQEKNSDVNYVMDVATIERLLAAERERIANQIDRMPFGDTAASFAVWIREGAP